MTLLIGVAMSLTALVLIVVFGIHLVIGQLLTPLTKNIFEDCQASFPDYDSSLHPASLILLFHQFSLTSLLSFNPFLFLLGVLGELIWRVSFFQCWDGCVNFFDGFRIITSLTQEFSTPP